MRLVGNSIREPGPLANGGGVPSMVWQQVIDLQDLEEEQPPPASLPPFSEAAASESCAGAALATWTRGGASDGGAASLSRASGTRGGGGVARQALRMPWWPSRMELLPWASPRMALRLSWMILRFTSTIFWLSMCFSKRCETSRERMSKSRALDGPLTRRQPLRNSSALIEPSPDVSSKSKRVLASERRMSTASKKFCMCGWSSADSKSSHVMVPLLL
mmetsp:Transcript_49423/g.152468  ORF Transcript_49423/g.152468 Transcript_49423/m.152468 type:complete len:218 (+) Transcript_49423:559-1212(+)